MFLDDADIVHKPAEITAKKKRKKENQLAIYLIQCAKTEANI